MHQDDLVIFSRNREEHAAHVRTVINRLNAANLILNRDKCAFFSTQISLLGFVVGLQDASDVGIGAVLYQLPSGPEHPEDIRYISFMARSLQVSEHYTQDSR
ncbi:hypothetical protein BG005_001195 [Podila minutissima]|nr:hypothetical protein BG005_001195 [Podila minutissima]